MGTLPFFFPFFFFSFLDVAFFFSRVIVVLFLFFFFFCLTRHNFYFLINWVIAFFFFSCLSLFCFSWSSFFNKGCMSKFIQTHFFHPSIFPLPTKQKGEKLKFFLSSHHFLSFYFSTLPTKRALKFEIRSTRLILHII